MTKINKRLLSLVMAVMMIISLLPASVMAEEATLPAAKVTKQDKQTLSSYKVWDGVAFGSDHLTAGTEELTLDAVVNFEVQETLAECLEGGYADWNVDFNLTISGLTNGSISSADCYLAGNYGTYGWIVIPAPVLTSTLYQGYSYPIVANYEPNLTYKDICKSMKNFTAGLHVSDEVLAQNPDIVISLELVMYKDTEKYQIGDDIIYTYTDLTETTLPQAEVTVLGKKTLAENEYRTWNWVVSDDESAALVPGEGELPLEVVLNFRTVDTLEECLLGGYAKWLVDFNITVDGLKDGALVGDECYMAGNYGSYGWIKIPLDGRTYENGVTYPVVANYDPTLNYKDICKSVKDFTAALHIDQEILDANPDLTVTLTLKMTNPNNANDTMQIGEAYVYDVDALSNGAAAQNVQTGELFTSVQDGLDEAKSGETVILLRNYTEEEVYVRSGRSLDLNGFVLTAEAVALPFASSNLVDSTEGEGLLAVEKGNLALDESNIQLPVWTEDGEVSGYRFASLGIKQKATLQNADRAYYRFYFTGDNNDCMLANQLKDGGEDNNISIQVQLTWKDAAGSAASKTYQFSEEDVAGYASNWTGKMFYLYINGVENVSELKLTAAVVSNTHTNADVTITGDAATPA